MTRYDRRVELLGVACTLALALALALLFAPGLLPFGVVTADRLGTVIVSTIGFGALAGLLALVALFRGVKDRSAAASVPDDLDEASERRRPGADFDDRLEAATTTDRIPGDRRRELQSSIRAELRELAIERYRQQQGVDRATAVAAVDRGSWTDDPVAAAYLGEETPDVPLLDWLRLLSHPRGSVYAQVERTVGALGGDRT